MVRQKRITAFLMVVVLVVVGMAAPAWAAEALTFEELAVEALLISLKQYDTLYFKTHAVFVSNDGSAQVVLTQSERFNTQGTSDHVHYVKILSNSDKGVYYNGSEYVYHVSMDKLGTQWNASLGRGFYLRADHYVTDLSCSRPVYNVAGLSKIECGIAVESPTELYHYLIGPLLEEAQGAKNRLILSGYEELLEAIELGESLMGLELTNYNTYDTTKTALEDALENLVFGESLLEELIEEAEGKERELYTVSSWESMQRVLEEAKELLSSGNAIADEINRLAPYLRNAIDNLEPLPDSGELRELLAQAQKIPNSYTVASWNALQAAIKGAARLLDSQDYTAADVTAAAKALREAMENLKELPPGSLAPSTLEPMIDSLLAALAVIVPVGICILAILLLVSLWPRILKRFTRG